MKIGIIREGKTPRDNRVPLSPSQCVNIQNRYPVQIFVQASPHRCFSDQEYSKKNIPLKENLEGCDILLGVKEVPIQDLLEQKTYFFFSHTIKKQSYNRKLLQTILQKKIRLIDYETLKDTNGNRVIAFGKFAGMVGAHNAIWAFGKRSGKYDLPRMHEFFNYSEAREAYKLLNLPAFKIVLTGTGRVSGGAAKVLKDAGIARVSPLSFINNHYNYPVFTQLGPKQYAKRKDGKPFIYLKDFFSQPEHFESKFAPYTHTAEVMINGIYWDPASPAFFTLEEMQSQNFSIKLISDITCDIAPESSIPSTIRPSTIDDPIYGFDPGKNKETKPFRANAMDVIAVDNLPNELPRDASMAFGRQFMDHVLPELMKKKSAMLDAATIANNGLLTSHYQYLRDFVEGK